MATDQGTVTTLALLQSMLDRGERSAIREEDRGEKLALLKIEADQRQLERLNNRIDNQMQYIQDLEKAASQMGLSLNRMESSEEPTTGDFRRTVGEQMRFVADDYDEAIGSLEQLNMKASQIRSSITAFQRGAQRAQPFFQQFRTAGDRDTTLQQAGTLDQQEIGLLSDYLDDQLLTGEEKQGILAAAAGMSVTGELIDEGNLNARLSELRMRQQAGSGFKQDLSGIRQATDYFTQIAGQAGFDEDLGIAVVKPDASAGEVFAARDSVAVSVARMIMKGADDGETPDDLLRMIEQFEESDSDSERVAIAHDMVRMARGYDNVAEAFDFTRLFFDDKPKLRALEAGLNLYARYDAAAVGASGIDPSSPLGQRLVSRMAGVSPAGTQAPNPKPAEGTRTDEGGGSFFESVGRFFSDLVNPFRLEEGQDPRQIENYLWGFRLDEDSPLRRLGEVPSPQEDNLEPIRGGTPQAIKDVAGTVISGLESLRKMQTDAGIPDLDEASEATVRGIERGLAAMAPLIDAYTALYMGEPKVIALDPIIQEQIDKMIFYLGHEEQTGAPINLTGDESLADLTQKMLRKQGYGPENFDYLNKRQRLRFRRGLARLNAMKEQALRNMKRETNRVR